MAGMNKPQEEPEEGLLNTGTLPADMTFVGNASMNQTVMDTADGAAAEMGKTMPMLRPPAADAPGGDAPGGGAPGGANTSEVAVAAMGAIVQMYERAREDADFRAATAERVAAEKAATLEAERAQERLKAQEAATLASMKHAEARVVEAERQLLRVMQDADDFAQNGHNQRTRDRISGRHRNSRTGPGERRRSSRSRYGGDSAESDLYHTDESTASQKMRRRRRTRASASTRDPVPGVVGGVPGGLSGYGDGRKGKVASAGRHLRSGRQAEEGEVDLPTGPAELDLLTFQSSVPGVTQRRKAVGRERELKDSVRKAKNDGLSDGEVPQGDMGKIAGTEEGGRLAHAPMDGWAPQDSDSGGEMEDGEVPLHLARGVDQDLARKMMEQLGVSGPAVRAPVAGRMDGWGTSIPAHTGTYLGSGAHRRSGLSAGPDDGPAKGFDAMAPETAWMAPPYDP